jgi:GTPase
VFVDEVVIHVRAGDGGAGVVSFERQRGRPRGKPLGGSGGRGGDVVIEADPSVTTLLEYQRRPHRKAASGSHGGGDLQHGRRGDDLVIPVPVGTLVKDDAGVVIADLARPGQRVTVLQGGRGGKGNAALSGPRRVAPSFAEQGEYGATADFTLELKLIADAAIVGFPNSGKSTLISSVSAARPKIADYPFTTLEPNLGVVEVDGRQFVLADVPGLIEGASSGRGLGHRFLRHVERARALVVLLDPSPLQEEDCERQLEVLLHELEEHDPDLAHRERVVAVSKADLGEARDAHQRLGGAEAGVHLVSAATGAGVESLMHAVADAIGRAEPPEADSGGFVLHRPAPPAFEIGHDGERWVVTGLVAERAVAFDDLTVPEAAALAARRLRAAGVDDALRERGAVPGDEVRIGSLVFEYTDEEDRDLERDDAEGRPSQPPDTSGPT